jgi:MFS family permease
VTDDTHPPATTPRPRSSGAVLTDRNFAPFFVGNLTSNTGNWLFNVSAAVVVFQLTRSAFMVGLVSVAQFLPLVVLSPAAGGVADRVDRRRMVILSQSFAAAAASVLAVASVVVGVDGLPGAWPIIAAAAGIGVGNAVSQPALQSLVPALVPPQDLATAVSLTSLTYNVGRAVGPAGAGVLLVTLGAEVAFVINAVSFLVLIGALFLVRARRRAEEPGDEPDRSVRAGLRYVRADPRILLLLGGVATAGVAADPAITLAPSFADLLGHGEGLVAAITSGFGVAAIPAALASGRLQNRFGSAPVAGAGMAIMAAGASCVALGPTAWLALVGFSSTGAGFVLAVTSFTTLLQTQLPDALRGRVMALWTVAFLGNRPLAAAIDGAAADLVGPRLAMGIAITVALAGVLIARQLTTEDRHRSSQPPAG